MLNLSGSPEIDYEIISSETPFLIRSKANEYYKPEDKLRTLSAWRLLALALKKETGLRVNDQKIAFNKYGKPYFIGSSIPYFNISHSGNIVICSNRNQSNRR